MARRCRRLVLCLPDSAAVDAVVSDRAEPCRHDRLMLVRDGSEPRPLGVTAVSRYNQQPVVAPDG